MDIKKFMLSYYKNATEDFHIASLTSPRDALELHFHDYFQVYFVLEGSITHHVEKASATLSSGDVFILPPEVPHYIRITGKPLHFFSMSFLPEFVRKEREANPMLNDFLETLSTSPVETIQPRLTLPHTEAVFVETLFKAILTEFVEKKAGNKDLIRECVSVLLTLFARNYFQTNAENLSLEWKKETALHCIRYLKAHFDEDIRLEEMARRFAMSKTSFCALFSSVAGCSFKEYLTSLRMGKATELLARGEKAGIVAEKCGYDDFSTFYRNFKKKTGLSPTEYQKSIEKGFTQA